MVGIGSRKWLLSVTIGLLSLTYNNAELKEQIRKLTVRNLKFVTTYQANIAAHHAGPVDKEQKKNFLEAWKGSFFPSEETITKLYNLVEKDWRYALDLASSNEDTLSALVVTVHIKMEAYLLFLYYLPCFTIKGNPEGYNSEHCQNLAISLLIWSYVGTNQLIEKLMSIVGSSLRPDYCYGIGLFQRLVAVSYTRYMYYLREKQPYLPHAELTPLSGSLDEHVNFLGTGDKTLGLIKLLSSRMMLGYVPGSEEGEGCMSYWYDADYVKFTWEKAKDINKSLTELSEGDVNYNVISALLDIMIQRAEFGNVSQQDFANELNEEKLKNLEIRVIEGEFSINLN